MAGCPLTEGVLNVFGRIAVPWDLFRKIPRKLLAVFEARQVDLVAVLPQCPLPCLARLCSSHYFSFRLPVAYLAYEAAGAGHPRLVPIAAAILAPWNRPFSMKISLVCIPATRTPAR